MPPLDGRLNFTGDLLDFNERELVPSKKVVDSIYKFITTRGLNRYPEYGDLQKKIAKYAGVGVEQVMITNGSDHAIDVLFRTFVGKNDKVVLPVPTFPMFEQYLKIQDCKIIKVFYKKSDFSFPLENVSNSIIKNKPKVVILCNPNNPTGTVIQVKDIDDIVKKNQNTVFVIDEAYFEFSNINSVSLINKFPNIIILRTFSKAFGLASIRMGYVIANSIHIKEMLKVRGPYSVNMLANVATIAALDDISNMKKYVNEVSGSRVIVEDFFIKNNIYFAKSNANFILFRPKDKNKLFEYFLKNNIRVRSQSAKSIEDTLRVSVGLTEQSKRFVDVYSRFLALKK